MKKNGLFTFIFACIPGAGQMYYGYMQRGLSLISLFCLSYLLGYYIGPLLVLCPIVWMYSFFDTYDLIRRLTQGAPREDSLLVFKDLASLRLLSAGNKLVGWGLVGLGAWVLYDRLVGPLVETYFSWYIADMIPTLVVAALLIADGLWLLRGPRAQKTGDLPPFPGAAGADGGPAPEPADMAWNTPDDTFGTGPAPAWPKAGVHGRPDADAADTAEAAANDLTADDNSANNASDADSANG